MSQTPRSQARHQHSKFDLSSIWFAFKRKWFLIVFLGATLSAGSGYAVWRFLPPPKASANVVFEIQATAPSIVERLPSERDTIAFKQYQTNLVTKRSVVAAVLNEPGIMSIKECANSKDSVKWVEDVLKIDFRMGRDLMRVSADLEKAQDALALIKAVQKNYLFEAVIKEKEARASKLDTASKLKVSKTKALEDELSRIRELSEKGGAASDKVGALMQEFYEKLRNDAVNERTKWTSEIRRMEVDLAELKPYAAKAAQSDPPEHMIVAELAANPQLKAETEHLAALEDELKRLVATLNPGVSIPRLDQLKEAVATQKSVVDKLPNTLRRAAIEAAKLKNVIGTGAQKEAIESKLAAAKKLEKKLEEDVEAYEKKSKKMTVVQHDFNLAQDQISQLRKSKEFLADTVEKLSNEIDAPDRVIPFQEPTVTMPDDATRRLKFALIGGLAGLVVGAAPFWLRELRRRIFHEEAQLIESVPIPLIGTIPNIPRKRRAHAKDAVVAQPRMRALVTESIDSARATVLFKLQEAGGRSVMITSSVAGEAKSSVSGHIAISLARAGFRTLIIDSDMRRPTLHRVFGVQKGPGFSDVLLGRKNLDQATQSCPLQNLTVLSAGEWIPAASASLASGAWTELLAEAKEQYDIVIVDSPPVLLVADALTMARDVDALLLSTLKDVSEIDLVNKAIGKLESLGISPMGMIASGVTHRTYTSRYYDRYVQAYSKQARN